jgi:hypothetical protein
MLVLLLAIPALAWGVEFSAQMVVKDGDKLMPGKIFFRDGKMRQEFQDEKGQTITIVRPDKKVLWVILPQDQIYVEMPLKSRLPGQFIQMPPDALSKRLVGSETVNGCAADKFEVTVRCGGGVEQQTIWQAPKFGTPIKVVCPSRSFSIEYRNIKESGVADSLFDPPPGCKKTTQLTGFTRKVKEEVE